jgi:hypothetical protein
VGGRISLGTKVFTRTARRGERAKRKKKEEEERGEKRKRRKKKKRALVQAACRPVSEG